MRRLILPLIALGLGLPFFCTSVQAQAIDNEPPPRITIPVEVAMIYHRLLNTAPSFEQLAIDSPRLKNTPEFGRNALVTDEKTKLEKVYGTITRDTLITIRQPVQIKTINETKQTLEFKNLDADTPFLFPVGTTTYGIFIRNAPAMVSPVQGPFYKGIDWRGLKDFYDENRLIIAEMTLKPMGADEHDFTTYQDDVVKPILADLIEIRLYNPQETNRLLMAKRDEKAFQSRTELGELVEDDLKEEAADMKAAPVPVPLTPTQPLSATPATAAETRR